MSTSKFRGLNVFIQDIRAAQNDAEKERKRVDKEMANIRQKFTSSKGLDSYNRKKYVWKMIFMFMMGYEVDFGHMEIINCLSAQKYSEKHVGYVGISLLLKNTDEMMTLVINSIQQDLKERERDEVQCLALAGIANIGGQMLTDAVGSSVLRLLTTGNTPAVVRKKAALTLLRLYRIDQTVIDVEETAPRLSLLVEARDLGVVTCVASLILSLCAKEKGGSRFQHLSNVVAPCILRLAQLVLHRTCTPDYLYYQTASPWLQVKLLQILQYFNPPDDGSLRARMDEVLGRILTHTEVTKSVNKNNADHAILFEACNLIIHHCSLPNDVGNSKLRDQAVTLLARFISVREPNIRYLGLSSMTKLAKLGDVGHLIAEHQNRILFTLKDGDISIRRRALDLVFAMCNESNAEELVDELLNYLVRADPDIRSEMILKIAVLAERFQTDLKWYIDTILNIIVTSGQHVSEEIWHRVVQIITNNEDLHVYATKKIYNALLVSGKTSTESLVSLSAYVVGEFGDAWVEEEENNVSPSDMYETLHSHFHRVAPSTKALLLSTYVKMANIYDNLRPRIRDVYKSMSTDIDIEGQQRAVEYTKLSAMKAKRSEIVEAVLEVMPPFPARGNALENLLKKKSEKSKDSAEQKSGSSDDDGSDEDEDEDEENNSGSENSDSEEENNDGSSAFVNDKNKEEDSESSGSDNEGNNRSNNGGDGGGVGDLLDLMGGGGGNDAVAPRPAADDQGIPTSIMPKVLECFRKGCVRGKQLLYMDGTLQVGIQQQYSGHQGKVMLFVANKSSSASITNLHVEIETTNYLKWSPNCQRTLDNITLGPNEQQKLMVQFMTMKPFASPPELKLRYVANNNTSFKYGLRLPIVLTRFVAPANGMAANKYTQLWSNMDPQKKQSQGVCDAGCAISNVIPQIQALIKHGLRFGLVENVTTNQYVVTAAGSFKTGSKDSNGKQQIVGCLLKLECNPSNNKFRVTVRAHHLDVAKAVKTIVLNQLSGVDFTRGGPNSNDPAYDGGATGM